MDVGVRSYRSGGLVTLGVPQNRRRKVVILTTTQEDFEKNDGVGYIRRITGMEFRESSKAGLTAEESCSRSTRK
jgi:hypothetical protein